MLWENKGAIASVERKLISVIMSFSQWLYAFGETSHISVASLIKLIVLDNLF